jgi:hypothetical protein
MVFFCWITALLASYQSELVGRLAQKGYTVGLMTADYKPITDGSAVIALVVSKTLGDETTMTDAIPVYQDIGTALKDMKALYYSIVVSPEIVYGSIYCGANFNIEPKDKSISDATIKRNNSLN